MNSFDPFGEVDLEEVKGNIRREAMRDLNTQGRTVAANIQFRVSGSTYSMVREVLDSLPGLTRSGDSYEVPMSTQPEPPPVEAPSKPPAKAKAAEPPSREARRPRNQNEHFWCIMNIRGLSAVERTVAFYLHGLCYVDGGEREATKEYLAYKSEISQRSVVAATKKLVAIGLFDRLDNGKGGRNKQNRAKYRPMVPGWWTGNAA